MAPKRLVGLRRGLADARQPVPGNRRKVVMLVVVAHVERNLVQLAVVAIGLLAREEDVVFLDPSGSQRVEADAEEQRGEQVEKSTGPDPYPHRHVEGDLRDEIQHDPSVDGLDLAQSRGSQGLKYGKQDEPDRL